MKSKNLRALFVLSVVATVLAGCELIVDFDRTKIPVDQTEAGEPADTGTPETSVADTGATDAATDAPEADSGSEPTDAGDAGD